MQDIPAIAAAAHKRDACVVMDNTWATPLFFPPHERGVDLAIEAGTKYLSGHSDLLLGLVSANEKYWPRLKETHDTMSNCAGPEDVFLALRGLRTMELRLREAERQGLALAKWLRRARKFRACCIPPCPRIPAMPSGSAISSARPACSRRSSNPLRANRSQPCSTVWNCSGSAIPGAGSKVSSSRSTAAATAPRQRGAQGPALRFSVGLENMEDLQADLERGFAAMKAAG